MKLFGKRSYRKFSWLLFPVCLFFYAPESIRAQAPSEEDEYYPITTIPVPEGIDLEAGGVEVLQDGSLVVVTRRGDVWMVENPGLERGTQPNFRLFASGLHEPLGVTFVNGSFYVAQRGELTKLTDNNGDRVADVYETVYAWPVSGHYHEYSYGPIMGPDSSFYVTGNVAFGSEEWWRGESRVPWRGWTLHIQKDGTMEPWATGMRSPAGLGMIDGKLFYTDNQGDWMGSGGLWHLPKGAFTGHPAGLKWAELPGSPVELTQEKFYARVDKRQVRKNGVYVKPENITDEENPNFLYQVKQDFPELQLPAVILPHAILGISTSQFKQDQTAGKFGPFQGQIFVGDQGQSKISRVFLEEVNGEYQGAAFDFRAGFQSGVLRLDWDHQGRLFVGETNRGWGSAGDKTSGLEYIKWTGKMPFEMKAVRAMPDGFEVEFTLPVDSASANDLDSYQAKSYIYKYHPVYGSPQTKIEEPTIKGVKLSDDRLKVRIVTDDLRQYYVHEFALNGLRSKENNKELLHPKFYYTLNNIPSGPSLNVSELSTYRSKKSATKKKAPAKTTATASAKPMISEAEIEKLLTNNTCIACHQKDTRVVGPAYRDIAKRKYTAEQIVHLIYNPQPSNWPEYETEMAPMPQVPEEEALKIAQWINSLSD